jgi:hypothetical protein
VLAVAHQQQCGREFYQEDIYALSPMSHLQTASEYPDMAAIGFIQQFALLNRDTRPLDKAGNTYTANSFPIYAAYKHGDEPVGVAVPEPLSLSDCTACQGLDFKNTATNTQLVADIISKKPPGFYVFSAPWETISALLVNINDQQRYGLDLPTTFMGSNHVYAISNAPSGSAKLVSYNIQCRKAECEHSRLQCSENGHRRRAAYRHFDSEILGGFQIQFRVRCNLHRDCVNANNLSFLRSFQRRLCSVTK